MFIENKQILNQNNSVGSGNYRVSKWKKNPKILIPNYSIFEMFN